MRTKSPTRPITIFTPSCADEEDTNAQNLTVKEIVARLPPEQFHVTMVSEGNPDPRIAERRNTQLVHWSDHWNTVRLFRHCLFPKPDIYFFPRCGPLDRTFFDSRNYLGRGTALVSYIVMMMNDQTATGLISRSIVEADRVCTNSKYVADSVREKFGIESTTVHDGIDRRFFFAQTEGKGTRSSDPLVVLYAGSLQPRKRVELLIHEAARWPTVEFRVAGRGETEERCRALCQKHDCRNVSFLGHLSSQATRRRNATSACLLFPEHSRGPSPGARTSRGLRLAGNRYESVPARLRRAWGNGLPGRIGCGFNAGTGSSSSRFCIAALDGVSCCPALTLL